MSLPHFGSHCLKSGKVTRADAWPAPARRRRAAAHSTRIVTGDGKGGERKGKDEASAALLSDDGLGRQARDEARAEERISAVELCVYACVCVCVILLKSREKQGRTTICVASSSVLLANILLDRSRSS